MQQTVGAATTNYTLDLTRNAGPLSAATGGQTTYYLYGGRNPIGEYTNDWAYYQFAVVIPFLPFSTFREPGGMLRFSSGLVLATLLFAARFRMTRALNYTLAWLALNAILLN